MERIFEIVSNISTPLGLAGVFAAVFFYLLKKIIEKDIFPSLTKKFASEVIRLIIDRVFILSLVAMILGFVGYVFSVALESNKDPQNGIVLTPQPISTSKPELETTATPTPLTQENSSSGNDKETILYRVIINAPQDAQISINGEIKGSGSVELQLTEGMYLITVENDTHIWSYSKQINGEKFFNISSDEMKLKS